MTTQGAAETAGAATGGTAGPTPAASATAMNQARRFMSIPQWVWTACLGAGAGYPCHRGRDFTHLPYNARWASSPRPAATSGFGSIRAVPSDDVTAETTPPSPAGPAA